MSAAAVTDSPRACSGAEVRRGAEHGPDLGMARSAERAGDPEICQLHLPVGAAENVLRLDVPVHEPLGVRRLECGAQLDPDGDDLIGRQPPAASQLVGERLALDVLHHDERPPLVLADVVDLNHVRMGELGRVACLAQEPRAKRLVGSELGASTFRATDRLSARSRAR